MNTDASKLTRNFFGRIMPERTGIRAELPPTTADIAAFDLKLSFGKVVIWNSQVIASVAVVGGAADVFTLRNLLGDHVRSFLDLIGHQVGIALELDLVGATSPDHADWQIFGTDIPALSSAKGVLDQGPRDLSMELVVAAVTDMAAQAALADFRRSMSDATGTGFYCYRAIESLMQSFRSGTVSEKSAWQLLRTSLNVARDILDFIKSHADDRRHGKIGSITEQDRKAIFVATDQIIQRYLTHLVAKTRSGEGELTLTAVRAAT